MDNPLLPTAVAVVAILYLHSGTNLLGHPCPQVVESSKNPATTPATSPNLIAAKVNDQAITHADLERAAGAQMVALQEQIFRLKRSALEKLIADRLLAQEAQKKGCSAQQVVKAILAGVAVKPEEVEFLYGLSRENYVGKTETEAKQILEQDLLNRKRREAYRRGIELLKQKADIQVFLETPTAPALAVDVGQSPAKGPAQAPVTIVEFADFECSFCARMRESLNRLLEKYPEQVRLVFKHFPTSSGSQAMEKARASECVRRQGKFWEFHELLFASGTQQGKIDLQEEARKLGLDSALFSACLTSEATAALIQIDVDEGHRLGVMGTAALIINGNLIRGFKSYEELIGFVEGILRKASSAKQVPATP